MELHNTNVSGTTKDIVLRNYTTQILVDLQTQSLMELNNINVSGTTNTKFNGTTQHKCPRNYKHEV